MVKKILAKFISSKEICKDTFEISLSLDGEKLNFQAGQYIQIKLLKMKYSDYKGDSRIFSIVSSPNGDSVIKIAFRNSESGFKKSLIEYNGGDFVEIEGPFGSFTLSKKKNKIVFIAGGIGITPCLSMINFSLREKLENKISLIYLNRDKENSAYMSELDELNKEKDFNLISRFGRIDKEFVISNVKEFDESLWYVVGPPGMVSGVRNILNEIGITSDKVFFEEFDGL